MKNNNQYSNIMSSRLKSGHIGHFGGTLMDTLFCSYLFVFQLLISFGHFGHFKRESKTM